MKKIIIIFSFLISFSFLKIISVNTYGFPLSYGFHEVGNNSFSVIQIDSNNKLQYSILYEVSCVLNNCRMRSNQYSIKFNFFSNNDTQQRTACYNSIYALNNTFLHFNS
jgi:hypothetical protein